MKFTTNIIIAIAVGVLLLGGGAGYYFYSQYQKAQTSKTDPQAAQRSVQEEVKKLVAAVGKLIDLPTGEDPTIATVTDITKLKDQPFFQKAKNGDKVLIYTNARKAILYDPVLNRVIDIAPINIGTPSAQPAQPKVALRNGTTTVGLTTKIETELKKTLPQIVIVSKDNAEKNSYDKTAVVVLNENSKDTAASLAKILNVTVGNLPAGEIKPKDADILIILGKDRI